LSPDIRCSPIRLGRSGRVTSHSGQSA